MPLSLSSLYRSKLFTNQKSIPEIREATNEYIELVSDGTKVAGFNQINKDPCWIVPKTFYEFLYSTLKKLLKGDMLPWQKSKPYLTKEQRESDMVAFENNVMMAHWWEQQIKQVEGSASKFQVAFWKRMQIVLFTRIGQAKDNIKYFVLCACVYDRFYAICCMMLCYIWYFSWVKKTILSLVGNLGAQNTDCKGPKKNDLSYAVFLLSILCNLKSTWVT